MSAAVGRDGSGWAAALDAMEADLDEWTELAAAEPGADVALPPAAPPAADLGPLPASLAERARALLDRAAQVYADLIGTREAVGLEMAALRVHHGSRYGHLQPAPVRIDERG
jgi:hypothetical protein